MSRKLLIVVAILLGISLLSVFEILWAPNSFEGDRFVTVSKGENFRQVIDSLEYAGIVRSRILLDVAGRMLGLTTRMQIGKYRFRSGMSNKEILEDIRYGKTIEMIVVTLPEGIRPGRQAHIFTRLLGIDSVRYVTLVNDSSFAHSLGVQSPTLMGYLTPMTYKFYWQTDEAEIIRALVGEFWKVFNDTLREQMQKEGLTLNQVLTMASIVENETAVDSERPIIAGVYYNRLKKGMRLQADPTVQYLLEAGPRRLHYSDLYMNSPYNTYRNIGLPPGPIGNPGRASILAALYPKKHKYLFFVANGFGGHRFSRTFSEHTKAIRSYRKFREEQQAAKQIGY